MFFSKFSRRRKFLRLSAVSEFGNTSAAKTQRNIPRVRPSISFKSSVLLHFPDGGRIKTQATTDGDEEFQVCLLTPRAREVLEEIAAERKARRIVGNVGKLIFTRDDGRKITRDMISRAVKRASKAAGVKKFKFHDYRNTALTEWSRQGVHVDIAMKASGHTSVVMHKRYLDLKREDVAAAFGTGKVLKQERI